jgi:hypothetical protein
MAMIPEEYRSHWIVRFSIACVVAVAAIAAICLLVVGSLGVDPGLLGPLILGITFTVTLGIGLMALVFYSSRSGQDEGVQIDLPKRNDD